MEKLLEKLINDNSTPVLIWGLPGVGKTATVQAVAKKLGKHMEVVIASIREPSDFLGLPVIASGEVKFAPPKWAVNLVNAGGGILFLDEITTAPPAVQAALLRVVLDRTVGDLTLPAETIIVAAANPPEYAAGGWELSAPLANRFIHVDWELDPVKWADEFPLYWGKKPIPTGVAERVKISEFIRVRPELLFSFPKDEESRGRAWPSPRSWDMASKLLVSGIDDISPAVGNSAAIEFVAWGKSYDIPDPEIALATGKLDLPARGDLAHAAITAVITLAVSKGDEKSWLTAWRIIGTVPPDLGAVASRALAKAKKASWAMPPEVKNFVPLLKEAGLL